MYLFTCLSVCLSVCLSICLSVCQSICLSTCLSFHVCTYIGVPVCCNAMYCCFADIIISIKSGDSSDSPTDGVSTESPPSLTPNNLSNSTAVLPAAPQRLLVPGIFYKIRPGQYSSRGTYVITVHSRA